MNTNESSQYSLYDIYDNNGVMLIPKNTLLTPELLTMLDRRHIHYQTVQQQSDTTPELTKPPTKSVQYFLEDIFDHAGKLMVRRGTEVTPSLESLLQMRRIAYRIGSKTDLQIAPSAVTDNNDDWWKSDIGMDNNSLECFCATDYSNNNFSVDDLLAETVAITRPNTTDIRQNVTTVATRIPFLDYTTLSEASAIVANILNDSKSKVWGLHISALANYVEWTYSHSINVAIIACILAKQLNLSNKQLNNLIISALLHDIGMVIVPQTILTTTNALSPEDKKLINEHPRIGYHMLLNVDLPQEILLAILQHHERIDGQGYPDKRCAKDITCFAKILRIIDTFDSITSDRPYRNACSVYEALTRMQNESPGEFDQTLFAEFTKLFKT